MLHVQKMWGDCGSPPPIPIALELWTMVFSLFDLYWVMPMRVIDMFVAWQGTIGKHRNIAFWKAVPNCIMLCLWQERNSRSFEGCEWNILEIKTFFLHTLLDWSAAFLSPPFFSSHLFDHCILN